MNTKSRYLIECKTKESYEVAKNALLTFDGLKIELNNYDGTFDFIIESTAAHVDVLKMQGLSIIYDRSLQYVMQGPTLSNEIHFSLALVVRKKEDLSFPIFTPLEQTIIQIVMATPQLTNQQIRAKLHQTETLPNLTKPLINKTLHGLKDRNILTFEEKGKDKVWQCVNK